MNRTEAIASVGLAAVERVDSETLNLSNGKNRRGMYEWEASAVLDESRFLVVTHEMSTETLDSTTYEFVDSAWDHPSYEIQ